MSRIPDQFLEELHSRVDVVEIIDSRVKLRKTGKNYSACCPFHKEKTPSFSVSPDKQFYYCFGCGVSGTALNFLMEYEHLGFRDAVDSLASMAGLTVPKEKSTFKQKSNKNLYTMLEKSQLYYQEQLKLHPKRQEAVTYLKGRGLTGVVAKQFCVGYAAPGWDNLLAKLGLNDEDRKLLIDSGMITVNDDSGKRYDRFRQRIMFPIIDVRGRTIGFGGRVLVSPTQPLQADGKKKAAGPKYLNSPETPVFHKSRELYGLYQALKSGRKLDSLLVVEGYMDVIALAQFGITNAVATMGTACGEDHLKLGFRYTNQMIFCFDGDNAGRKAAKRALENALPAMLDGRRITFLFLPEGQDPDTLVRQIGEERFRQQLEASVPLEVFFFESVSEGIDIRTMEGRARMSKLAAPLLNGLPKGVFRELMFESLAQRTGLGLDTLQELVGEKVTLVPALDAVEFKPEDPVETPPFDVVDYGYDEGRDGADVDESHFQDLPPPMVEARREVPRPPKPASSDRVKLSPVRLATTLLLEEPSLLLEGGLDVALPEGSQRVDLDQLRQLIDYLKLRPGTSFHGILGFWGGNYGMEAQKQLADLVANQFLGSARRTARYDSGAELSDALARIRQDYELEKQSREMLELSSLATLTTEQSRRLVELLQLKQSAKMTKTQ